MAHTRDRHVAPGLVRPGRDLLTKGTRKHSIRHVAMSSALADSSQRRVPGEARSNTTLPSVVRQQATSAIGPRQARGVGSEVGRIPGRAMQQTPSELLVSTTPGPPFASGCWILGMLDERRPAVSVYRRKSTVHSRKHFRPGNAQGVAERATSRCLLFAIPITRPDKFATPRAASRDARRDSGIHSRCACSVAPTT